MIDNGKLYRNAQAAMGECDEMATLRTKLTAAEERVRVLSEAIDPLITHLENQPVYTKVFDRGRVMLPGSELRLVMLIGNARQALGDSHD